MNRAVFFDKDGVLNIDKGIEYNLKEVNLYSWSGDLIAKLRSQGFKIFIVTNQPMVARWQKEKPLLQTPRLRLN